MATAIEHVRATDSVETVLQVLRRDGVVVVEGLVDPPVLDRINRDLDPHMAEAALTTPELN